MTKMEEMGQSVQYMALLSLLC